MSALGAAFRAAMGPTRYAALSYGRLLEEAAKLARAHGGKLPQKYSSPLADATGYAPETIEHLLSRLRLGKHGKPLQQQAAAIGEAKTGRPNWQRARVAELMDRGLGPEAILERVNALRAEPPAMLGPTTNGVIRSQMSQIRRRRRETGDPHAIGVLLGLGGLGGLGAGFYPAQEYA